MTPLEVFLIAALTGLATYAGWATKAYIAHLVSDLDYSRKTSHRGTATAERAVAALEEKAG